jgi:hypothetical protein
MVRCFFFLIVIIISDLTSTVYRHNYLGLLELIACVSTACIQGIYYSSEIKDTVGGIFLRIIFTLLVGCLAVLAGIVAKTSDKYIAVLPPLVTTQVLATVYAPVAPEENL